MDNCTAEEQQQQQTDKGDDQHIEEQLVIFTEDVVLWIDDTCAPTQFLHRTPLHGITFVRPIEHVVVSTVQIEWHIAFLTRNHRLSRFSCIGTFFQIVGDSLVHQFFAIWVHNICAVAIEQYTV